MVDFLEEQVKIASDPVFRDIRDVCTTNRDTRKLKSQVHTRFKEGYFATSVTAFEKENYKVKEKERATEMRSCLFCRKLSRVGKKNTKNQIAFLKENVVCFGCL